MKNIINIELSDHDIDQLRELMDNLPLATHAPLVVAVLKALPITPEHAYLQGVGRPTCWDDSPGDRDPYLATGNAIEDRPEWRNPHGITQR